MSMSLDDIWDEPLQKAVTHTRNPVAHSPAKRSRTTLFDPSDSENEAPRHKDSTSTRKTDITALFDDLDGDDDLAPALDLDALGREADARNAPPLLTPHQILPTQAGGDAAGGEEGDSAAGAKRSKEGDGLNKKRVMPKMDEARLLGPDGFPALLKQAKGFKPRGKGHELQDLDRLLGVYQFWTHKMYPKTQFADTVQRVEKLCHSKRMHSALGVWRDDAKGLVNGLRLEDLRDEDGDAEGDRENEADGQISLAPREVLDSVASERTSATNDVTVTTISRPPSNTLDDDADMWDSLMDGIEEEVVSQPQPRPPPQSAEDDEDMWDLVREMEQEAAAKETSGGAASTRPSHSQGVKATEREKPTNEEGWDEMYM